MLLLDEICDPIICSVLYTMLRSKIATIYVLPIQACWGYEFESFMSSEYEVAHL